MKTYHLFKIGSVWHYRFQVDGLQVRKSTRETVQSKAESVATKAYEGAVLRSRGEKPCPTLRELVALWLTAHERTAGKAHLRAVETFGRLHLYDLGDVLLSDLTTEWVEEVRLLHSLDHADTSTDQWLKYLQLLVRWAIRQHMIREMGWSVQTFAEQGYTEEPDPCLP